MDYERIESISKSLSDSRVNIRLRAANNFIQKLENGIIDKDAMSNSACLTTLLSGVHKSLTMILENQNDLADHSKETNELLQALLLIVQKTVKDPTQSNSLDVSTKILEQLYFLKEAGYISGSAKQSIEDTIRTLCGYNKPEVFTPSAHIELDLRTAHLAGAANASVKSMVDSNNSSSRFRGAGAILNSRLVHTGWKFPPFVLTERDERWLLDVQIKVKLQNERAARDLWDVLEDFPPQAVLQNTHLLHCVLDLVGTPFSQADVDADPQGLHCLSAMKWLETLLQKCTHAFSVQLDGSLCTHAPYSEGQNEDMPDLAGKLAQAMYALRHPSLPPTNPTTASTTSDPASSRADAAAASLFPGPSVSGLAFACCAASLPLLQSGDTSVGRAVRALLQVALPLLLEPRLAQQQQQQQQQKEELLEVEHSRLQYLVNRVEQLLAFFGDTFDMDAFLALIDEDDDNTCDNVNQHSKDNHTDSNHTDRLPALQHHTFHLTFLSCVLDLYRCVPAQALLPSKQLDDGSSHKLSVGPHSLQCLYKIAATSSTLEALLPGCTATVHNTLNVLDGAALANIEATRRIFTTARLFTSKIDGSLSSGALLERFLHAAQACVSLLDANCTVPVTTLQQQAIAATLPILLQAAYERFDAEEIDAERAVTMVCALIVRVLSCGAPSVKSILLTHLQTWLTRSYEMLPFPGTITAPGLFSEQQVQLIKQLNLDPSSGRQIVSVLATPTMVQALLHCTIHTPVKAEQGSEAHSSNSYSEVALVVSQAQQVLEVLCAYALQYHGDFTTTSNEEVHQWSHLLLPLKLAEWEAEAEHQNSNHLNTTFSTTNTHHHAEMSHEALTNFARHLQESCAGSPSMALQTTFARSLVVGLFHRDSAVRINSALRVRRDLLHVPLPTGLNDGGTVEGTEVGNMYSVLGYDLFPTGGVLKLGPWQTNPLSTPVAKGKTMRVPNDSTITHASVRKVALIGLGELEASQRATALSQLVSMLINDTHLLHTVDIEWAYATVKAALLQLAALAPFVKKATSSTLQCDATLLVGMSDAECRLFLQTMRVVSFFFTHFAALRQKVYFHAEKCTTEDNYSVHTGVLNVSVLLRLLLGAHLLQNKKCSTNSRTIPSGTTNPSNTSNSNISSSAGYEVLLQVAGECAQVLAILTCNADSWVPLNTDITTNSNTTISDVITDVGVKYEYSHSSLEGESESDFSAHAVSIPSHLSTRFLFPTSLTSSKNEYSIKYSDTNNTATRGKIAAAVLTTTCLNNRTNNLNSVHSMDISPSASFVLVQLSCQPMRPVAYPPVDILSLVVHGTTAPSADRIKTLTATKLFSFVIHAANHTALRESLSCTLALCQADPLLLHVFVALRISLVTAVSHIVTVNPRTHKDHVTLSVVLDFLSAAFTSLLCTTSTSSFTTSSTSHTSTNTSSPAFRTEVAEWFSEALSAILPLMRQYLGEHYPHASAHPPAHSTELAREHSAVAHAVSASYFRLLHVLTLFVHPKYALSSVLTGHYVLSLLVHIASSELHGACDRALSLRILENVVRLQEDGWQALCCIENPAYSALTGRSPKHNLSPTAGRSVSGKGHNLAVFAAEAEQFNVVETLVRVVRLVRTPDSLQNHAAVVGALRLLLLSLQRQNSDTSITAAEYSLAQSERDWKWLIRLIYDRRSEVKVLALEILSLVLERITTVRSEAAEDGDRSVDSLNATDESKHTGETEKKEEKEEELVQWPPFELLTHLCADSTESTALRVRALQVLVTARLDLPVLYIIVQRHFKLPVVLGALHECLSVRDGDCAVTSSIHSVLQLLMRLITTRDETLVQETLALCSTMKVTPLVVEVLNVRLQSSLQLRALRRVSVWEEEYISRGNTTYFHQDTLACALRDNRDTSSYLLLGSGWRSLQLMHLRKDTEALKDIRTLACWFFFHLRAAEPGIFAQCVQHSTLLHHLVTCFSAVTHGSQTVAPAADPSLQGFIFECGSVTAQAELLSLIISLESANIPSVEGPLHKYVTQNEAVPGNVLKKIVLVLLSAMDFEVTDNTVRTIQVPRRQQQQLQCISACLRLLVIMLNESHWRRGLGLGRDKSSSEEEGSSESMSTACAYLFELLLSMRRVIATLVASNTSAEAEAEEAILCAEVLVQRIDFTVALFMQHSVEARGLFVQHSVHTQLAIVERDSHSGRTSSHSEMCLFQQHVNTLARAVAILNSPATTNTPSTINAAHASAGGAATGKNVISAEAKRSLQALKAKTSTSTSGINSTVSVSTGASTVKRGAGNINKRHINASTPANTTINTTTNSSIGQSLPVGQSTSTWATSKTSVTSGSSRWRDKSRSYQWNKDKDSSNSMHGAHRTASANTNANAGAAELSDAMKRQLWAALMVLSQVMPSCPTAVDWAIDLQLHQSLSKLLRFAARYSIGTLVSSSTTSAATSLLHHLDSAYSTDHHASAIAGAAGDASWVPSNGLLAAGIYSLCCAFTHHHTHAKQCFVATGEAAAAVLHTNNTTAASKAAAAGAGAGNASAGTALHQLITLGVTRSMAPVSRWLSLGLAGSLLSGTKNIGSSAMKSTFSQMVALTLQRSLHAAYSDPDAIVPLLTTLTSFLSSEEDLAHLTQLCRKDSHAGLLKHFPLTVGAGGAGNAVVGDNSGGKDAMVEEFKRVTFPELLSWVHSASNSSISGSGSGTRSDEVAVAISRVLGRISLVDKAHRTVGNLLSEDMLALLCENYVSSHPLVSSVSALSLWHIVHHSEKAKHMVRELINQNPHYTCSAGSHGGAGRDKENAHCVAHRNYCVEGEEEEEGELEGAQKARFVLDSLRTAT